MKTTHVWLLSVILITVLHSSYLQACPSLQKATLQIRKENSDNLARDYPVCDTPFAQPRYVSMGTAKTDSASGYIEPVAGISNYLVVISTNSSLGFVPVTGASYAIGSTVGSGKVVKAGNGINFTATGLMANTNYYVYVFSMNTNCPGGTVYRSFNPAAVMVHTAGAGSGN